MRATKGMGAVVVAAALVLGACSGSDEPASGSGVGGEASVDLAAAEPLSQVADLEGSDVDADAETADLLVAELGIEGALRGVLLALDRGYDVDQIVDADAGSLAVDGTIDGVEPSRETTGVYEETSAGLTENGVLEQIVALLPGGSGPPEPVPISESLERLRARDDEGRGLVFLILALARAGYDVEQITEAIVLDDAVASTLATGPDVPEDASNLDRLCPVLVSNGERVVPTLVDSSICRDRFVDTGLIDESVAGDDATGGPASPPAPAPAPEPEPVSLDGTYAGTLDRDVEIFDDFIDQRGGTMTSNEATVIVGDEVVEQVTAGFVVSNVRFGCPVTARFSLESDSEGAVVDGVASLAGVTRLTTTACPDSDGVVGVEPVDIELVFVGERVDMTFTFPAGTVRTATLAAVGDGD